MKTKRILILVLFLITLGACDSVNVNTAEYENGINCYGGEEYQGICYEICDDDEYSFNQACMPNETQIDIIGEKADELSLSDTISYSYNPEVIETLDYSDDERDHEFYYYVISNRDESIVFPDENFNLVIKEHIAFMELFDLTSTDRIYYLDEYLVDSNMTMIEFNEYVEEVEITFNKIREIDILDARFRDIRSIEGIELFYGLVTLRLDGNNYLTSINGISWLDNLQNLYVSGTAVKKIDYRSIAKSEINASFTLTEMNAGEVASLAYYNSSIENATLTLVGSPNVKIESNDLFSWSSQFGLNVYLSFGQIYFEKFTSSQLVRETNSGYEFRMGQVFLDYTQRYNLDPRRDITSLYNEMLDYHTKRIGNLEGLSEQQKFIVIYDYFYQKYKDRLIQEQNYPSYNNLLNIGWSLTTYDVSQLVCMFALRNGIRCNIKSNFSFRYYDIDTPTFSAEGIEYEVLGEHVNECLSVGFSNGDTYLVDMNYAFNQYTENQNDDSEFDYFLVSKETIKNRNFQELFAEYSISDLLLYQILSNGTEDFVYSYEDGYFRLFSFNRRYYSLYSYDYDRTKLLADIKGI